MIRFFCGTCKERLAVPAQYAGRKGKCPGCGNLNRVPLASEFEGPIALPQPVMVRPPKPKQPADAAKPVFAPPEADLPPAMLVEVFPDDDAAGFSKVSKIVLGLGLLAILAGAIWAIGYLIIWLQMRAAAG